MGCDGYRQVRQSPRVLLRPHARVGRQRNEYHRRIVIARSAALAHDGVFLTDRWTAQTRSLPTGLPFSSSRRSSSAGSNASTQRFKANAPRGSPLCLHPTDTGATCSPLPAPSRRATALKTSLGRWLRSSAVPEHADLPSRKAARPPVAFSAPATTSLKRSSHSK